MSRIKVVVWDNIGNTILGMRAWSDWSPEVRARLLTERPDAEAQVVSLHDLFEGHDLELEWLYDPVKSRRGFTALFDEYRSSLRAIEGQDDIAAALADADVLILHKESLPADVLSSASRLQLIQHLGNDYRGVPLEAARQHGIPVAATPLVNYSAVAEHVWALVLAHLKRLRDQREYVASRDYRREWGAYHPGVSILSDLTLGLLGMGEIARPVARVARAFNMRTVYWDIQRFPEIEEQYQLEFVGWDDLFEESDVLSVQLALNEQTENIIGSREFGLMKPTSLFVNTARGRLVDQDALIEALRSGSIGGAALDVFAEEPLPVDSPLHELHKDPRHHVTLTPHSAAQGPWTWVRDSQELWFNVRRVLDHEPLKYLVDESVGSPQPVASER